MVVLIPSFITSELKTAFQIGFIIFIPFLVIDIVVASVLMAMGMMMLSPLIISLPFKIMLFVLVDGWAMLMGTLAASYGVLQ
jgi:flagellar biosynthetic protein FliP